MDKENIFNIIKKNGKSEGRLIAILEEIQETYTYLPEAALSVVAKETGYSLTDIYSVATFYKAFSLKPKGKHCMHACMGTACHVRGAQKIVEEFSKELGIKPGETTPDNEITLETVNCLGACALGPIVVSDGHYFANVNTGQVKKIVQNTIDGTFGTAKKSKEPAFTIDASCPLCKHSLMDSANCLDGYPSIKMHVSLNGKNGQVSMTSLYGIFNRIHEHEMPENTVTSFFCPFCHSPLPNYSNCMECSAPLAAININGGDGVLEICTRTGCNGHLLELNNKVR